MRCPTYLFAREVDADCPVPEQTERDLVVLPRDAANHHVAKREAVLQLPIHHVHDFVAPLAEALAAVELLHVVDVNGVNAGPVVGQESSERPAHNLGSVDDCDGVPVQTVPIRQDGLVDLQVLEDLYEREGRARENALFLPFVVEKPLVLIQVEQILVAQAFDVLFSIDYLLEVLILSIAEYGVVDDDSIHDWILVGANYSLLNVVSFHDSQFKCKPTGRFSTSLILD